MLERLYVQLDDARRIVREAEAECEELADDYTEKLGEFVAASIARRDGEDRLELAQEVEG